MEEITLTKLNELLTQYAEELREGIIKRLEQDGRKASGNLIKSIKTGVEEEEDKLLITLTAEDYLKYLETGTKPHFPPPDDLIRWIQNKNLPTRERTGNKSLPTEKSLAYLIGRKINERGTPANNYVHNEVDQLYDKYRDKIWEAFEEDITTYYKDAIPSIEIRFKLT